MREDIILDSGASNHFFGNKNMFIGEIEPYTGTLECASEAVKIEGIGIIWVDPIMRN